MIEKKPLEKEILNSICNYLGENKFFFWRANNIPVYGKNNAGKYMYRSLPKHTPKGIPDIIVVLRGIIIGIEVKRKDAKLRPEQADFGIRLIKAGGIYFVARSVEDVKKHLDMHTDKFPTMELS